MQYRRLPVTDRSDLELGAERERNLALVCVILTADKDADSSLSG